MHRKERKGVPNASLSVQLSAIKPSVVVNFLNTSIEDLLTFSGDFQIT